MALETSAEKPIPVRTASRLLQNWITRLGAVWVEGQIAELRRRRTQAYLTLRDTDANMSIPVTVPLDRLDGSAVDTGQRIVAQLKVEYWSNNGSVQWRALSLRPVGVGALMQRLEELRKTLAAEGLFADERKKPLPFLPRRVGVICGRRAAAQQDVIVNARDRWPAAQFDVREVAVQGPNCVPQVIGALRELDGAPEVDVIVITRGGGSFEDLMGFSNEALLREVVACTTPVVSAIGHEEDTPLLDLVADHRASTPTAAGKTIVPDARLEREAISLAAQRLVRTARASVSRERHGLEATAARLGNLNPARMIQNRRDGLGAARRQIRNAACSRLNSERERLEAIRRHPALSRPDRLIDPRSREISLALQHLRRLATAGVASRQREVAADAARLRALSPQGTLDRGYAVVRRLDGSLVTDAAKVRAAEPLLVRVRRGSFDVTVAERTKDD